MRADVPVLPDADSAREWAVEELAKPEYREGSGLSLDAFWEWLRELFARIGDAGGSLGVPGAVVVGIIVAAALALITWLVLGPLRRSRQRASAGSVFDDDSRPWRVIRDSAREAQARGEWDLAVVEWFRAAVRIELERGAILDSPGVTAHEAAMRVGEAVPPARVRIHDDAEAFARARYGAGGLGPSDAQHAESTFAQIESHRRTEAAPA